MEWTELALLLNKHTPTRFAGMCALIEMLSDEITVTREELITMSTDAQKASDYSAAKELLELQIELDSKKTELQNLWGHAIEPLLPVSDKAEQSQVVNEDVNVSEAKYTLFENDEENTRSTGMEDWTYKKPESFVLRGIRYPEKQWKTMLIHILGLLYKDNPEIIQSMEQSGYISGMKGIKLSKERNTLRSPGHIRGSQIWIETNLSANNIRDAILVLLRTYNIPASDFSVSFGRDYSDRHTAQPL